MCFFGSRNSTPPRVFHQPPLQKDFKVPQNPQAHLTPLRRSGRNTAATPLAPLYIIRKKARTALHYVSFTVARLSDILCGNSLPHGSNLPLHRISSFVSIIYLVNFCKIFLKRFERIYNLLTIMKVFLFTFH